MNHKCTRIIKNTTVYVTVYCACYLKLKEGSLYMGFFIFKNHFKCCQKKNTTLTITVVSSFFYPVFIVHSHCFLFIFSKKNYSASYTYLHIPKSLDKMTL